MKMSNLRGFLCSFDLAEFLKFQFQSFRFFTMGFVVDQDPGLIYDLATLVKVL